MSKMARPLDKILEDLFVWKPKSKPSYALVFLHGLGDTGQHLCDLFGELDLPIMVICPTAPVSPVSLNRGMRMPSWFDVHHLGGGDKYDLDSLSRAAAEIHALLDSDVLSGIEHSRVFLGGLSQGGALALYTAYTYPKDFAGIILLSCWMPLDKEAFAKCARHNQRTPVLQCHSTKDSTVKYSAGQAVSEAIQAFNSAHYRLISYDVFSHYVFPDEMMDVKKYLLKQILPGEQVP